ncbi:MAG: carbon starvation protein A [Alistipes sp.]|nr:carbon starvation protein A [Alistipes sp.]
MITFFVCLSLLIAAYFLYGRFLDRVCRIDPEAEVPSKRLYDGVDYMPMPRWRVFLIQLLNIAGIGPIFGAVLGACFGPVAFLWITFGGIFLGAMHDYLSGVIILRNDGRSLPEIVGRYLGGGVRQFMRWFTLLLLILVGVVFLRSPASILSEMTGWSNYIWLGIIVVYYFVATLMPIDKIIGKIYPLFGAALIIMALSLAGVILFGGYEVPELTSITNAQSNPAAMPVMPMLFITIACGAISGFHATQSPLMARCAGNERECRSIFYGAMISESIIALIWAAVAMAFFHGADGLGASLAEHGNDAGWAVMTITRTTLGVVGGILAVLGVVAAPITSGDTAFRSARLIVADMLHIEQHSISRRMAVCVPLFAVGIGITFVDFDVIWRYFAWSNQTLAVIVLWTIVAWLRAEGRSVWIALLPALFMTYVCSSFVFVSSQFIGMGAQPMAYVYGGAATAVITAVMIRISRVSAKNGCVPSHADRKI